MSTSAAGITTAATDFNFSSGGSTGKAAFIFANLDGSISAWKAGETATIEATVAGASFTGLGIGNSGGQAFRSTPPTRTAPTSTSSTVKWQMTGSFTDPIEPPQRLHGVQRAEPQRQRCPDPFCHLCEPGNPIGGIVDEFNTDGTFIKTLINDTGANPTLAAPWGLALAPGVGASSVTTCWSANNDGAGTINAYNVATGVWQGSLTINAGPASNSVGRSLGHHVR